MAPENDFYHLPSSSLYLSTLHSKLLVITATTIYVFDEFVPLIDDFIREPISVYFLPELDLTQSVSLLRVVTDVFAISTLSKPPLSNALTHLKTQSNRLSVSVSPRDVSAVS